MTDERGLLFDMDGLLLDTERVACDTFVDQTSAWLARDVAEAAVLAMVGSSGKQTQAAVEALLPAHVNFEDFNTAWHKAFHARLESHIPLKPGAAEVVLGLARRGRKMAVVTSSRTANARRHLEQAGLLVAFQMVIGGDAVERNKPDPEPYLKGAAAIGLAPEMCVAFEDSDKGTAAAMAAGCATWQIPDLRPSAPLPDLGQNTAASLKEAADAAGLDYSRG